MTHKSTTWNYWGGLSFLAVLTITLVVGWWLGQRSRALEVESLKSEVQRVSSQGAVENLRAENDDLIQFIDEVYALLKDAGIHIQLDLEVDPDGHYRLRADSAKIKDALQAKLRELNAK